MAEEPGTESAGATSHFRTIGVSCPPCEQGGLRFVTVKSPALARRADITLFIPEQARGRRNVPLVVLLHGVYASHWAWAFCGGAHETARRLMEEKAISPMVLAMPCDGLWGDGTAYLDQSAGNFERWIMEDVPAAAAEAGGCTGSDSPLLLSGLSMGGYGALRLGLKHAARVRAISAHSSITHLRDLRDFLEEPLESFGPLDREELDPVFWALRHRDCLPPLRFDCGTEDFLLEQNRLLHYRLKEAAIPHLYEEYSGGHTWDYWREHLRDSLLFFHNVLASMQ